MSCLSHRLKTQPWPPSRPVQLRVLHPQWDLALFEGAGWS